MIVHFVAREIEKGRERAGEESIEGERAGEESIEETKSKADNIVTRQAYRPTN